MAADVLRGGRELRQRRPQGGRGPPQDAGADHGRAQPGRQAGRGAGTEAAGIDWDYQNSRMDLEIMRIVQCPWLIPTAIKHSARGKMESDQ